MFTQFEVRDTNHKSTFSSRPQKKKRGPAIYSGSESTVWIVCLERRPKSADSEQSVIYSIRRPGSLNRVESRKWIFWSEPFSELLRSDENRFQNLDSPY